MIDLAVVIVSWNVRELILNALQTLIDDLEGNGGLSYQVYVVDSASTDGTAEAVQAHFPQVHVTASEKNLGFAGGNNLALRQIGFGSNADADTLPRAVYLLNPDTLTTLGATKTLYDRLMGVPDLGVVGARLSYEDGSFQHSAFMFPGLKQLWVEFFPTPGRLIEGQFNGRYPVTLTSGSAPFAVDFMLGATMMLKREVILQTGMFDEAFFMYCEEIDWQWRIHEAGWLIECVPSAHVVHLAGKSTSQIRAQSQINLWTSRLLLFRKHFPAWKLWIARWMVVAGMLRKEYALKRDFTLSDEQKIELLEAFRQIRRLAQT